MRFILISSLVLFFSAGVASACDYEKAQQAYAFGNYKKAVTELQCLAEKGHTKAQHYLGEMYYYGEGVTADNKTAAEWFSKAADQGYAEAQAFLGAMYQKGKGVERSNTEAAKWHRLAADQGNVVGQFNLGWMYEFGEGVSQDYDEAARLYRLAAYQGDGDAQNNLGRLYYHGRGVQQDYVKAYMWAYLAYRNAFDGEAKDKATRGLDLSEKYLSPSEISQAQTMAKRCFRTKYAGG
ncbi:MAG: tetratricopeptide repeat protein [Parvularculales bacterium]